MQSASVVLPHACLLTSYRMSRPSQQPMLFGVLLQSMMRLGLYQFDNLLMYPPFRRPLSFAMPASIKARDPEKAELFHRWKNSACFVLCGLEKLSEIGR